MCHKYKKVHVEVLGQTGESSEKNNDELLTHLTQEWTYIKESRRNIPKL